jgi:hypothetical protein
MVSETGDHSTYKENLDAFQAANYLSLRQRNTVESIVEAGHAAIHRGWKPTDDNVSAVMDIIESVIETTYLHEPGAKKLETQVPRRRPLSGPQDDLEI